MEQFSEMNIRELSKYTLGSLALAGLLAGCSSGGSQSGLTPSAVTPANTSTHRTTTNAHMVHMNGASVHGDIVGQKNHRGFGPNVAFTCPQVSTATGPCLYVSDLVNNEVQVYSYANGFVGAEKALLFGFNGPDGICTGKSKAQGTMGKNVVWIVNNGGSQIWGYQYGQDSPTYIVNVFDPDPGYIPVGCSLDPKTGDLAVTDITSTVGGPGNVAIFTPQDQSISNSPPSKVLLAGNIFNYYWLGWDGKGDLFVDGLDNSGVVPEFAEFAGPNFVSTPITICGPSPTCPPLNPNPPGVITFPGSIQYDSETTWMSFGSQGNGATTHSIQYEFQIVGNQAFEKRHTGMYMVSPPYNTFQDVVEYNLDVKTDRLFAPDDTNLVESLYQHTDGGGCGTPCYPTVIVPGLPPFGSAFGTALLRH
jgi:hypothetical protein